MHLDLIIFGVAAYEGPLSTFLVHENNTPPPSHKNVSKAAPYQDSN